MFDFDFLNLSQEELSHYLSQGFNPLLGCRFKGDSSDDIIKMITILHAAYNEEELDPAKHFVYIVGTDSGVEIKEWTKISKFAERISDALYEATGAYSEHLTKEKIQFAILQYLLKNKYLELRDSPFETRKQSYFATGKGEDCGIRNYKGKSDKNKHIVYYSGYIQAFIVRKLPEILADMKIFEFAISHIKDAVRNIIEPLSLEEQNLISKYRDLHAASKKLIKQTIETLCATNKNSESQAFDNTIERAIDEMENAQFRNIKCD